MCGIAGLWTPYNTLQDKERYIYQMAQALEHRGPDGNGFHVDSVQGLAMAHTRLSIIDLHTGEQPIIDKKAGVIL